MARFDQFGSATPGQPGGSRDCLRYEAMLADVLDGTLSVEDQADFDRHRLTCDSCSQMLLDAQRGADLLALLKAERPQPSATLVERILLETSVRAAQEAEAVRSAQKAAADASSLLGATHRAPMPPAVGASEAVSVSGKVLPFRSRVPALLRPALGAVLQTRFAMTAAMAFFSVALTLNLVGVHVSDLHARDLRPTSLRRNFYEANAHVVRYYENLRVVYELESRVRDLQRSADNPVAPAPQPVAPAAKPDTPPAGTQPAPGGRPAGKPHSGLSGDAGGRGPAASGNPSDIRSQRAGRSSSSFVPQGEILPVSLSHLSPFRQKRGLV